jgi:hypothetical protein
LMDGTLDFILEVTDLTKIYDLHHQKLQVF